MSQSENKKDRLFNAAVKVFSEKGFWKAKVSDIVKEANVAQGTFYLYFKSKNDCLKKILSTLYYETIENLYETVEKHSDIYDILKYLFSRINSHKALAKVFLFEAISSGNEFQGLYFTFKDNLKDIFFKYYSKKSSNIKNIEAKVTILSAIVREIMEDDILRKGDKEEVFLEKIKNIVSLIDEDMNN